MSARLLLAAALVCATAAVGVAAPRGGGGPDACPMSRLHACCKKARKKAADAPRLSSARLCCVANTPQPLPAGTAYTVQPAPGAAGDPRPAAAAAAYAHAPLHARPHAPTDSPAHSPPAYIRHASFLI